MEQSGAEIGIGLVFKYFIENRGQISHCHPRNPSCNGFERQKRNGEAFRFNAVIGQSKRDASLGLITGCAFAGRVRIPVPRQ